MAETTHIQWCDATFNGWMGCTKVSSGCLHCYAEVLSKRTGRGEYKKGVPRVRTSAAYWKQPLKWNRVGCGDCDSCIAGQRCSLVYHPRVFCASLSDWLDDEVPIEWLADLLALIHATPNLDWLLLSKRPQNWRERVNAAWQCLVDRYQETIGFDPVKSPILHKERIAKWLQRWVEEGTPPVSVWIGTTVEDQTRADERIPALLDIPARVRFLSCEPLLEEVNLGFTRAPRDEDYRGWAGDGPIDYVVTARAENIHWLIAGGESGGKAREMDKAWARSLRTQCDKASVAFFMKQLGGVKDARGELSQLPEDLRVREFPR